MAMWMRRGLCMIYRTGTHLGSQFGATVKLSVAWSPHQPVWPPRRRPCWLWRAHQILSKHGRT